MLEDFPPLNWKNMTISTQKLKWKHSGKTEEKNFPLIKESTDVSRTLDNFHSFTTQMMPLLESSQENFIFDSFLFWFIQRFGGVEEACDRTITILSKAFTLRREFIANMKKYYNDKPLSSYVQIAACMTKKQSTKFSMFAICILTTVKLFAITSCY